MRGVGATLLWGEQDTLYLVSNTVQYNCSTGRHTYSRYFRIEFAFTRAKYIAQPRQADPARTQLQAKIIELRASGWSFPAIARHLGISVGTAWNMVKYYETK